MTIPDTMKFDDRVIALQTEAGSAGDSEMWQICEDAINGDAGAVEKVRQALSAAEAMDQ